MARSLLVSIPGSAIGALPLPGSFFAWRDLRDAPLPPDLRLALELVVQAAAAEKLRLRFLARPEMFTHGAARAWLDARLEDTREHLILTDGETLRPLPGLENRMFFYARGLPKQEAALARLLRLAPELFASLAGQVNGSLAFRLGARWIRPPQRVLRFAATPALELPQHIPFLCHIGDPLRAATAAVEEALPPEDAPPLAGALHYVPLSFAALADAAFLHDLARRVQRAALGAGPPLLLGLPLAETPEAELPERIAALLRALLASRLPFPQAPCWHCRFATAPPAPALLAEGLVTLHPGTPFWRLGADALAATRVEVAGGGLLRPFQHLVAEWLGRAPELRRAVPDGPPVALGCVP